MPIRSRHEKFRFCVCGVISVFLVVNLVFWFTQSRSLQAIKFTANSEVGKRRLQIYMSNASFPRDEACVFTPDFLSETDCDKIINGDSAYIQSVLKSRIAVAEVNVDFPVDCASIHARGCYPNHPLSVEESEFPLAYAIVVYKDYILVESIFSSIFASQNSYCYVTDTKSTSVFKNQLKALASCFPNVHVLETEFDLDSRGHYMNEAYLACYEYLLTYRNHWKYVISLQNHDMPLRSNLDLVRILAIYNGSNDVEVTRANKDRIPRPKPDGSRRRSDPLYSWTLNSLQIVRHKLLPVNENEELSLTKGGTATMLTREFVDFILHKLDLTELLRRLTERDYTDEMLFSSLHASDALKAPGGHTGKCMTKQRFFSKGLTRSTHWYDQQKCKSGYIRHGVCIQGIENVPEMDQRHGLFMNKFLPDFDYGAIVCHLKKLLRQKLIPEKWPTFIDSEYYTMLPSIRLHNLRQQGKPFDFAAFDCTMFGKDTLI